ncbi:hypothetical protein [Virgisporangium aurantiacum]|uniref:Uncharacterized protein n=1 Tax=Virgisporangium aurantiacum TaxID=175570 RepID=A0A8J4E5S2_9ACTN|nr:hypothetical protein [Virgisporangium aurantiacum]GIJ63340.1 hypothetical protein Vau01_108560 [Virgisporangium aurantiacum]
MFRISRRPPVETGIRFCDRCAEVTTAAQRARDRHDRARTAAYTWAGVR